MAQRTNMPRVYIAMTVSSKITPAIAGTYRPGHSPPFGSLPSSPNGASELLDDLLPGLLSKLQSRLVSRIKAVAEGMPKLLQGLKLTPRQQRMHKLEAKAER